MSCARFEDRLEAFIAGELEPSTVTECNEHLSQCADCTELVALARVAYAPAVSQPPPELLRSVLDRTSGSPCQTVEPALCAAFEGELDAGLSALVERHLDSCGDCRRLRSTLAALESDLPRLASLAPGGDFVAGVLAATLPAQVRLARWWRRSWPRWIERPRFAAEVAYVATLIVLLVVSIPGSPLHAMPQRTLEIVRVDPLAAIEKTADRSARVLTQSTQVSAVIGSFERTAVLGLRAVGRSASAFNSGVDWTGQTFRTFRDRVASLLERVGEEPTEADAEPEENS